MKKIIKNIINIPFICQLIKFIGEYTINFECLLSRKWVASAHKRLLLLQWGLQPTPEFFDHQIDLYHQWLNNRNSLWVERGVFSSIALKGGRVLELACGDGFNAKNFYSLRSEFVLSCDFDKDAIKTAKTKNSASNVQYVLADIRTDMPGSNSTFENIIWDAAIEHFTENEIFAIMSNIKMRLKKSGILSGYTIVERNDGLKHLHQHEYEFKDKEDLLRFLAPYFSNVKVFETIFPDRHNLYFWASDGVLPFDPDWIHGISAHKRNYEH